MMDEVIWFDLLSDEAVSYAAHVWKISKAEAWGKLDRAIKAEEISQRLPFTELQEYVQTIAGIPPADSLPLPFGGMPKAGGHDARLDILHQYSKEPMYIPKKKEVNRTWEGLGFFIFTFIVHTYLWRNTDIPVELALFPWLISFITSAIIVTAVGYIIKLIANR